MASPASASLSRTNVRGIFKGVCFRVRERGKWLDQRSQRDGPPSVLPPRRKQNLRPGVEQEIGNSGILELTVQDANGRLRKESLRRRSWFRRLGRLNFRREE